MVNTRIGHRTHTRGPYKPRSDWYWDEPVRKCCHNCGEYFMTTVRKRVYCDPCEQTKDNEEKANMDKLATLKAEAKDKRKSHKSIDT